ncbi:sensor histidine kinase [Sphingomonas sp. PR090111-T3T-6A]|uniref:sensor histidine kinase n=1 Tax=Sphingomonas sp. PR090111-T3T-6A TaxID=685778 RepID=UPI0003805419|nr:ATP-binding protein [Sphingomonas sp. PR090111-T3T-6A]
MTVDIPAAALPIELQRFEAEMRRHDSACWAFDIARARTLIESVAAGQSPEGWIEALLSNMVVVEANANAVHLFGSYAGRRRMLGQSILGFWPREGWPILADLIVTAVTSHPRPHTRKLRMKSLVLRQTLFTARMCDHPDLADIMLLAVTADPVDERSFWALRVSEARYNNLIHHLPFAFLEVDSRAQADIFDDMRRKGLRNVEAYLDTNPTDILRACEIVRITDVNESAVQLFGARDASELIGPVDPLFSASPETAKRVMIHHFEGHRSYSEVIKLWTLDGRLLDVSLSVTYPTRPEQLDITLIMLEDITERLRTEAQLRQLQSDYTRAARISMLGELASSIAHEVNQPLSAILTYAETSLRWLSRDDANLEKVAQLTTRISDSARRAAEIVQRIRGMTARHVPRTVSLDLNEIVDEALHFVRHETETRSIALTVRLGRELPKICGDRVQLQQVIVNLLINAVQAIQSTGSPCGAIRLATDLDERGAVTFTIRDDGPGIAEADMSRLFQSFFTTKDEGMGIGLAICHSIIVAHGGTIGASSEPDGGARFWFSLPASR